MMMRPAAAIATPNGACTSVHSQHAAIARHVQPRRLQVTCASIAASEPVSTSSTGSVRLVELPFAAVPPPQLVISDASTRFMLQAEVAAQVQHAAHHGGEGPRHTQARLLKTVEGSVIIMSMLLYSVSPAIYAHSIYAQARRNFAAQNCNMQRGAAAGNRVLTKA